MVPKEIWHEVYKDRIIIGLTETIEITGPQGEMKEVKARIDTGATRSSIDSGLAKGLKLGPVTRTKFVKQAHGGTIRPIMKVEFQLAGRKLKQEFTIADRSHMKFEVLIGQNALKKGFLIDPNIK